MTALIALSLVVCVPSFTGPVLVPAASGRVVHYSVGIMEAVGRNRMNPNHRGYVPGFRLRTDVDGYASRPSCKTLGQVWHVRILNPRTGEWGPAETVQQVDCAEYRHYAQQVRSNLVLEVDYNTAKRNGFARAGKTRAVVWKD